MLNAPVEQIKEKILRVAVEAVEATLSDARLRGHLAHRYAAHALLGVQPQTDFTQSDENIVAFFYRKSFTHINPSNDKKSMNKIEECS